MIAFLCIIGVGLRASMPVFSLTVQNTVPLRDLGIASASSQLFRNLGNTIGIGILGTIMSSRMATGMSKVFSSGENIDLSQLPPDQAEKFGELMNPEVLLDQPKLEQIQSELPPEVLPYAKEMVVNIKDVFSDALTTTFLATSIIVTVAIVIALFLRSIPLVSASDKMPEESQKTPDNIRKKIVKIQLTMLKKHHYMYNCLA